MANDMNMVTDAEEPPVTPSFNQLEQFTILAKGTKGAACLELVKQVLETPGVHVFGELLLMPNIIELEHGPQAKCYRTLNLFAYGTYKDYMENPKEFLDLTPVMKKKLQHLTIVSMATRKKCIPYSDLLKELDIKNVRDLEDLIIEAIYADIIHGKLDQKNSQLEVDYALGRDIRPNDVSKIDETLQEWCDSCETVLKCIDEQIKRANSEKMKRLKHKEQIDLEIVNLKKALKAQLTDGDDQMASDSRESANQENRKNKCRSKSNRPSTGGNVKHRINKSTE